MPYTVASGPPDVDATHAWDPAGAAAAPPVMNDQGGVWPPVLPRIKVKPITGWRALAESEDNRAARTKGHGEVPYPSRKLGKTLVYECEIRAATIISVRDTMNAVTVGFENKDAEGVMTVTPWAYIGGPTWTFSARVIDMTPDPSFSYFERRLAPFRWGFSLSLRMSDPLFYTAGVGHP